MIPSYLSTYYPNIKDILLQRYVKCELIAEDLRGKIVEKVLRKKHQFTGDFSDFKKWMSIVIRNEFINYYRDQKLRPIPDNLDLLRNAPGRNSTLEDQELITNAIALIDKHKHSKLYRMYILGYKYDQIAEELSMPVGTVKGTIHHLKADLKKKLKIIEK